VVKVRINPNAFGNALGSSLAEASTSAKPGMYSLSDKRELYGTPLSYTPQIDPVDYSLTSAKQTPNWRMPATGVTTEPASVVSNLNEYMLNYPGSSRESYPEYEALAANGVNMLVPKNGAQLDNRALLNAAERRMNPGYYTSSRSLFELGDKLYNVPQSGLFQTMRDREEEMAAWQREAELASATGPQLRAWDGIKRENPALAYMRRDGAFDPLKDNWHNRQSASVQDGLINEFGGMVVKIGLKLLNPAWQVLKSTVLGEETLLRMELSGAIKSGLNADLRTTAPINGLDASVLNRGANTVAETAPSVVQKTISEMNFPPGNLKFSDSMNSDAFKKLVKSIDANGMQNKVITYVEIDGLDYIAVGNNRYMAAERNGTLGELRFQKSDFPVPNTNWYKAQDILDASGTVKIPKIYPKK
jgi:hypothetical protein